jgi:hypothetical protein
MYFRAVATSVPPSRYTKADCLSAFEASPWLARLDPRSHSLARTVLQRDNGIEARRLAVAYGLNSQDPGRMAVTASLPALFPDR